MSETNCIEAYRKLKAAIVRFNGIVANPPPDVSMVSEIRSLLEVKRELGDYVLEPLQ